MFWGVSTLLLSVAYIVVSVWLHFTPRFRVLLGLVVGSLLTGVVAKWIVDVVTAITNAVSGPIARGLGQRLSDVQAAVPSVLVLVLALILGSFLFGHRRGGGHGGHGHHGGRSSGGGKGGKVLPHVALGAAVVLPLVFPTFAQAIQGVAG